MSELTQEKLDYLVNFMESEEKKDWNKAIYDLGLNIHYDSLRKAFGSTNFSGYAVYKFMLDKNKDLLATEEMIRLENLIEEERSERHKKQRANLEYSRNFRNKKDTEYLYELLKDSLDNLCQIDIKKTVYKEKTDEESTGLLVVSDAHYGKHFKLNGLFGEVINEYSPEIYKTRMWKLLSDVENDSHRFKYDKLMIVDLGDCIEGILRSGSSLMKLSRGVNDSIIEYASFMATWLCEVHNRLKIPVEYSITGGNHDLLRLLSSNKDFDEENVGKLINKIIHDSVEIKKYEYKELYGEFPKIMIKGYDEGLYHNIYGINILTYHGESKSLKTDIEFFENFYQIDIDVCICGHLHSESKETLGIGYFGDRELVRVNSICGTDDFAKKIRKHSRAGAKFMLFNKDGKDLEKTYYLN